MWELFSYKVIRQGVFHFAALGIYILPNRPKLRDLVELWRCGNLQPAYLYGGIQDSLLARY